MKQFRIIDRLRIPTYDSMKQMQGGNLDFDKDKCRQCGICVRVCPGGCLLTESVTKMDILTGKKKGANSGIPHVDTLKSGMTLCVACYDCGAACPHGAISIKTNFDPKYFYKRLTQTSEMACPRRY